MLKMSKILVQKENEMLRSTWVETEGKRIPLEVRDRRGVRRRIQMFLNIQKQLNL